MGLGLGIAVGDGRLSVSDLRGATVTMVDGDDLADAVQLDRGSQVVPERLVPVLEGGCDDTDGGAGDRELAVLAGEMPSRRVLADRFLKAWVDTGQNHRLVLAAGREHGPRHEYGGRDTPDRGSQKTAPIGRWREQGGTAGRGSVLTKGIPRLPSHPIPPVTATCGSRRSLRFTVA